MAFNAEAARDHILECIEMKFKHNESYLGSIEMTIQLSHNALETKLDALRECDSESMRMNPDNCSLLYCDDDKIRVIPDNENLLQYEVNLSCENSCLEVRYPRVDGTPEAIPQNLEQYGVKPK